MKISDDGLALIKEFEGIRLEAYPDPATGGDPWTIGYGHTGKEVVPGLKIDEAEAERLLRVDCTHFEDCINELVEVELQQHQFDALVCFVFNLGCNAFRNSTLRRLINQENFEAAESQFARWDKAAGKVMPELTRRRSAEADLFSRMA